MIQAVSPGLSNLTYVYCNIRTLLRALDRESRLLSRAMLEEDEPLPSHDSGISGAGAEIIWMDLGRSSWVRPQRVSTLCCTGFVEPAEQRFRGQRDSAASVLSLLVFQGAFWKGWQSVITLLEVLAMLTVAGFGLVVFRKHFRRGSALALVLAGLCAALVLPSPAGATEFRKAPTVEVGQRETIKGDIYLSGERVRIEGTVEGDVLVGKDIDIDGHVTGDVIAGCQSMRIRGRVDGNLRAAGNNRIISGSVGRSVTWFGDSVTVDSIGKVGEGTRLHVRRQSGR